MLKARLPIALYTAFLATVVWVAHALPNYDWDMLAYIGCAVSLHESDPVKIHAAVFKEARELIPEDDYKELAEAVPFRHEVTWSAYHFTEQLPFYSIRPLYVLALEDAHRLGTSYVEATRLVSALALAWVGAVVFIWMRRYVGDGRAALICGALLLSNGISTAARTGTADALSGAFVLTGVYWLLEHSRPGPGAALLLASIYVRTDNIIIVLLILAYCALESTPSPPRMSRPAAVVLAAVAVGSVAVINHFSGNYGWAMLIRNSVDAVATPGELIIGASVRDYFDLASDLPRGIGEGSLFAFVLIAVLAFLSGRAPAKLRYLPLLILGAIAVRLALYPHLEDRYFVAQYAVIAVCAAASLARPAKQEPLERMRIFVRTSA